MEELVAAGEDSVSPLIEAIDDAGFRGRGYAAWALARVVTVLDPRPADAMEALEQAAADEDPYVRTLARSGLSQLR